MRHNLEAMNAAGGRAQRLVAVGGGTQGGLWTQIVSDITGQEQQIPAEMIGAAYGDALLAGIATVWNVVVAGPAIRDYAQLHEVIDHIQSLVVGS